MYWVIISQNVIMRIRKKKFCEDNNKDIHQMFEEQYDIKNFEEKMTVRLAEIQHCRPPWYLSATGYWLSSVVMLSIIPRIKLTMNTGHATIDIIKEIHIE